MINKQAVEEVAVEANPGESGRFVNGGSKVCYSK